MGMIWHRRKAANADCRCVMAPVTTRVGRYQPSRQIASFQMKPVVQPETAVAARTAR
jgi:hypothetical protein